MAVANLVNPVEDIGGTCEHVDIQSYTHHFVVNPVKLCFGKTKSVVFNPPHEYIVIDVGLIQDQVAQVDFNIIDVGLKPPEVQMPQTCTALTLNYCSANKNNKKHRYRCINRNDWGQEYRANFKT